MGKTKEELQEQKNAREMGAVFESYDYHVYKKVESLDHIISCMIRDAMTAGVSLRYAVLFTRDKLTDMIDQIAEQREANQKGRKTKD